MFAARCAYPSVEVHSAMIALWVARLSVEMGRAGEK
jgi:hypothetical protein